MTSTIMAPGANDTDTKPVQISDEATRALAEKMREWSGWPTARLVFGKPEGSPFANCNHVTRTFTANPERLVLNPNRVLLTLTPFRMRQEAVLTGALLHEASHARHSQWAPRSAEAAAVFVHSDGTPVTRQTMALAKLMEEPRIEGIMSHEADSVGAFGLGWTMRAAAAHLLPNTPVDPTDTDQQVMDVITSWALRAGRQIARLHQTHTGWGTPRLPNWVGDFNQLLHRVLLSHLESLGGIGAHSQVSVAVTMLTAMVTVGTEADTGTFMVDTARDILAILFPETDGDEDGAPMPGGGCQIELSDDESDGGDSDGGEGDGDPDGSDGVSEEPDTDEGDEGSGDSDTDADEGDEEGDQSGSGSSPSTDDGPQSDDEAGSGAEQETPLQQAIREMEDAAKHEAEDEAEDEAKSVPQGGGGGASGSGDESTGPQGYRTPTPAERGVQRGAERFLRSLVSPSESSKVVLTESPSATVDGSALAAWKAGGMVRDPHFFKRTRRNVEPMPPVQIAVLVDVSGSMEELQAPSALLSWALSAAAIDLRNFAGRGAQIQSTLIHWGSTARVIQHNGDPVPGIKEFGCYEGTYALDEACDLVEEEMPGFFEPSPDGQPVNRLLVQFTDWDLSRLCRTKVDLRIAQALEVGVNMLTVAPRDYRESRSDLPDILAKCHVQRGSSTLMRYNPMFPEQVWDESSRALA